MTTNFLNMNPNREKIIENKLIVDEFFKSENNPEHTKYLEQNQIKSSSFKVEKYKIIQKSKIESNNEKLITSYLPLEKESIDNDNSNALINNPSLMNEINLSNKKSLADVNSNSLARENISNINQANNLTNFSNFKTSKFFVVKESDLKAPESTEASKPKSKDEIQNLEKAKAELSIEKDLFLYLKKFPEKKNEFLQNLIKTYNINFSNNIIDLSHKNLGTTELELISTYLKKDSEKFHCEELKISNQRLSHKAMQDLSGFITQCNFLKFLDLSGCEIGDLGCRQFCEAFESQKNLSEINLQKNSIGDSGAEILSDLLVNNENISKLELEHNFIGNKGAGKLYEAIRKNLKVKWLNLFGNVSISNNFVAEISTQLKNNRISTRGRKPLKQYPES